MTADSPTGGPIDRPGEPGGADHRLGLAPGWDVWRTVALRGAGFPYRRLGAFASAAATEAAVRLAEAEGLLDRRCSELRTALWRALPVSTKDERKLLNKAIRRLKRREAPARIPEEPTFLRGLAEVERAVARVADARQGLVHSYAQAIDRTRDNLHQVARAPLFLEALAWQNRAVLDTAVASLLRRSHRSFDRENRKHALLVASYLQRYCAKNDSIGFFGPVAWAELDAEAEAARIEPGPDLLAERLTHFEFWAIDALAETVARDRGLRWWLAPRLSPSWRIVGSDLYGPGGRQIPLTDEQRRLFELLDGETLACRVAALLGRDTPEAMAELELFLDSLAQSRILIWRPALPVGPDPERRLRRLLEGVPDAGVRSRMLAPLDELERAKLRVSASAGDPEALCAAMQDLDETFERLTGFSPRRAAGQANAGRTLVYEDCRRDVSCAFGGDFLARLGGPLSLLLTGARWFTRQLSLQYMDLVRSVYAELCAETVGTCVSLDELWMRLQSQQETVRLIVDDVVEQYTERWEPLLLGGAEADVRRVALSVEGLRSAVEAAFPAPGPGWPGARFHSPDIMVAAESAQALREGRYQLVMGELHASGNTLFQAVWLALHSDPDELLASAELDQPEPELIAAVTRNCYGLRSAYDPATPHDIHFECDDTPSWRPRCQVLPIAELLVEEGPDGLAIRTRDGSRSFPGISFFGPQLRGFSARHLTLVAPGPHAPRISIDGLVVARETWRFEAQTLELAKARSGAECFAGFWRLARTKGLPRWLFLCTSLERKPVHLDLHSPLLVDLAAKMIRAAAAQEDGWVSLAEMLPRPDQLWLEDAAGERYTSELRMVVLDERRWVPEDLYAISE